MKLEEKKIPKTFVWLILLLYAFIHSYIAFSSTYQLPFWTIAAEVEIYLSIVLVWHLAFVLCSSANIEKFYGFCSYSFVLYCMHNLFLSYFLPIGRFVFKKSDFAMPILTMFSWAFAVLCSILMARYIYSRFPKLWHIMNGGRR